MILFSSEIFVVLLLWLRHLSVTLLTPIVFKNCKWYVERGVSKVLAMISYFQFHFFPHLVIFPPFQFRDPSCVLNLSTKAVQPEMTHSVQESQIFAVWINFLPGIN